MDSHACSTHQYLTSHMSPLTFSCLRFLICKKDSHHRPRGEAGTVRDERAEKQKVLAKPQVPF